MDGRIYGQKDKAIELPFRDGKNQLPKGIKWSAVPLPCSTFFLVFMGGGRAAAPIGDEVL